MNEDPLYPNDGSYFEVTEPQEQRADRQKQTNKQRASAAMLKDLIADYETDIEQLKSVDSIHNADELTDEEFKLAWTINQQLLTYIRGKKSYLESLLPN